LPGKGFWKCLISLHPSSLIWQGFFSDRWEVGVNKGELVERVRAAGDLTRAQAEAAVDTVLGAVMSAIQSGERVSIGGFGSFNLSSRAARTGRNPQTGEAVRIAASKSVRFSPATAFKQALNPRAARKKAAAGKVAGKKATGKKAAAKAAPVKKAGAKKVSAKKAAPKKAAKATKKR
jgi:DNA-binding protein HU-beta